ncbi:aminomethyltransferase [Paraliobacillus quinghaiensis]|uniref:Aminomethyltransferase n=1 Tax=Paraliobacillus quinghaiensis TaxID=470815 RepID=A0A917TVN2_9BACI|nr:glycine cleavage system aminomethyltransferase GcvT [Paraliobacillus quinghaiensis]GGM40039.1 aminomethyltransferase [Paraliobacillus quinghaiensis]
MEELKRTPLYPTYQKWGAKVIDFGGWALPVQFTGIKQEHHATRNAVGLFDVSHMGEFIVEGKASKLFLQQLLTNDLDKLEVNKAQYTIMCYPDGGTVDDLIIYQLAEEKYLLVVNAVNTDKDFNWLMEHKPNDVILTNQTDKFVQLAIQGPKAEKVLQKLTDTNLHAIKFFRFAQEVSFSGVKAKALVARTGYTGEDGFEIYIDATSGLAFWQSILTAGQADKIEPIGLGARDTLRFEANLALYGQELSDEITPIEAGLGFAVRTDKSIDFIGKDILEKQKKEGPKRKLVGIEMIEKGIPRHGYPVLIEDEQVGFVTSGTQSPTLNKNVGLVLIDAEYSKEGTIVTIKVRKKQLQAKVVSTPFYKRD